MRTTLGRRGDYAVRAMLDVARHWGNGRRKARDIAATMDIPVKFLTLILADLVGHRLLDGYQGPAGGYVLSRPPEEITLRQVVEAAEGAITLDQCVLQGGRCDWIEHCPIHDTWAGAQAAFTQQLEAATLAQLAGVDAAIRSESHPKVAAHDTPTVRRGQLR